MTTRPGSCAPHYIATAVLLLRRCLQLLPLLLLGVTQTAGAEPGPPYGERLIRVGDSWPREAPPAPQPLPAEAGQDNDALRQRISELEWASGPFAPGLGEALGDLARRLEAAGDLEEATAVRERALHLVRVNGGLQSPGQLPLLRDQLRTDRLRGDYAALDARYDYYWRLFGSGRPPYTDIRLGAALEYLRWQREALRRGLDPDNRERLLRLIELGNDFLQPMLEIPGSVPEGALLDAGRSQIKNLYLLASLVQPVQEPLDTRFRQPRSFSQEFDDWNPQRERLENMRRGVRRSGDALFDDLLAATDDPLARAGLLRDHGDWSQWWGERSRARDAYSQSWRLLQASGQGAVAEQWYGEPRPLPDNGVFVLPDEEVGAPVRLRIEVDDTGRARPEALDAAAAEERSVKRLLRFLRATRFRPALRDGSPVPATLEDAAFQLFE